MSAMQHKHFNTFLNDLMLSSKTSSAPTPFPLTNEQNGPTKLVREKCASPLTVHFELCADSLSTARTTRVLSAVRSSTPHVIFRSCPGQVRMNLPTLPLRPQQKWLVCLACREVLDVRV
ncbi:hypothetical protein SCP_0313570 [Sparassis crispa]|uniref:Uncharacterized protein n=1 Tax=Sparassis crispa TaxID=139825 RepID=A0A401GHK0_9APHY|nr:hypothetical protein SCP_0313570 [Sparassis crispa]GBE81628.1 hypothetical protein SCP_0313570 [Sparassis crispa]